MAASPRSLPEFLDDFENAPRAALDFAAAFDPDLGATRLQPQKWPNAKKRIASDLLSAFDRLQQKSIRLSTSHGQESGNRGQQIGRDSLRHRNQRSAA